MQKTNIGIVGCGNISNAYFTGAKTFDILNVVACADVNMDAARAKAAEHGCLAVTVAELMARKDIEIVVNLTIPQAHAAIALQALEAGKHTHCEKPLAVSLAEGRKVIDTARARGLRVGCAPDTFFGGGIQTCRKLIDDGLIGAPVAGTAFMMCHGHESWHPNPAFYYLPGGGPMFDMGPYYITALLNLLGPARRVSAVTARTFPTRTCTSAARQGEVLPVEVSTHLAGTVEFVNGAIITIVMSFDVWSHHHTNIEIYGTRGSLQAPDPNGFGGPVHALSVAEPGAGWQERALTHGYTGGHRCIGVADMAYAIRSGRPHRCDGALAYHALEIMHAFDTSSQTGRHVMLESTCARPAALPLGLTPGQLDP
jgi:predicted dehydrogenase